VFILVLLALETDTRQALYMVPVWFVLLAVGYRSVRRNKQEAESQACETQ
jgi:D-serine/D-alanine/glycine transporter